jgi:hypothetical protein
MKWLRMDHLSNRLIIQILLSIQRRKRRIGQARRILTKTLDAIFVALSFSGCNLAHVG